MNRLVLFATVLALGTVCFVTDTAVSQPNVGSQRETWLSEAFDTARAKRKLEVLQISDIIEAIDAHPQGNLFAKKKNLRSAIRAGLKAAADQQRKNESHPGDTGTPTPGQVGAMEVCRLVGVDYTKLDNPDDEQKGSEAK